MKRPNSYARIPFGLALVAAALVALPAAAIANHNDAIANPVVLPLNTFDTTTNTIATVEVDEPLTVPDDSSCVIGTSRRFSGATLWYVVTGNGGQIDLSTENSNFDTLLAVYDTATTPTISNGIGCSDDVSGSDVTSRLSFNSVSGLGYLVQVGGTQFCSPTPSCGQGGTGLTPADPPTGNVSLIARFTPPDPDTDGDGVLDSADNCDTVENDQVRCQEPAAPLEITSMTFSMSRPARLPKATRGARLRRLRRLRRRRPWS